MENTLTQITDYLATQSWQIAVLAAVIAAVSLLLKNKSAHLRYLLWLIVLAKCLTPPLLTIPLAVLPEEQIPQPAAVVPAEIPPLTIEPVRPVIYERPIILPSTPPVPEQPSIGQRLSGFALRQWLPLTWISGFILFFSATLIKALRTNSWLRGARRPLPAGLKESIDKLFRELGIRRCPRLWLVRDIGQPFVWGLLRGGIYLPADFARLDSAKHRRGILGHEMSHVLRFDAAVNLLQIIVQAVFWFHPFVWWANKKIRAEREKCCDEMAIARLNAEAKDYSTAIVNTLIAEHKSAKPIPSLAVAGPVKNIEDRIKTILKPDKKFYKRPTFIVIAGVALAAAITVPTTLALTSRPPKKPDVQVGGDGKQFKAELPNGVTVELVGVCEYDGESKGWLRPDGTVFDPDLYVQTRKEYKGQNRLAFVVKLSTEDFNLEFNIKGVQSYSGMDLYDTRGNVLHNYKAAVALIENNDDFTDIRIGVATEPWKTIAQFWVAKRDVSSPNDVIFSTPIESKNGTAISVRGEWDRDSGERRVIAIDKKGKTHMGSWYGRSSWDKTISMSEFKKIVPEQIEKYELQLRPYEWVTFKNVSLRPGLKTNVEVEIEDRTAKQENPGPDEEIAGSKLELMVAPSYSIFGREESRLTKEEVELHTSDLLNNGPKAARERKEQYVWYKLNEDVKTGDVLTCQYKNDTYVLVYNTPGAIMRADQGWGLKKVYAMQDSNGRPAVGFEFDEKGKKLFYELTKHNYYQWLATVVDGEVISLARIMGILRDKAMILGVKRFFTEGEVERMVEALQKGMPPVRSDTVEQDDALGGEGESLRVYEVNRRVSDFPEAEDFSTPEAAYAAINRVSAGGEASGWQRVSVKRLAERFAEKRDRAKMEVRPEWAKVLLNARILEVRIWKGIYAMVLAELPQEYSSEKIRAPIDLRSLEFEDGRWLNAGNNRVWTVQEGRAIFVETCEYHEGEAERESARKKRIEEVMKHPEEIVEAAKELFEKIRTADYDYFLRSEKPVCSESPIGGYYMTHTRWDKLVEWICKTFKDNPIVSVELGEVFIGDKQIKSKSGWPTVPYKLTLRDGGVLEGDLAFEYSFDGGAGHWHGMEGIDWHLQDEPIKRPAEEAEFEPTERVEMKERVKSAKQTKGPSKRGLTNEAIYRQLEEIFDLSKLTSEMHFADALDVIKNSVEPPLNVFVFWNDLYDEADVERTSPIKLDSDAKVPLKMAFNLLLDSVSGGFGDLTYTVADGLIYIGPKQSLRKKVKTSTHNISDVIGAPATATIP